MATVPLSGTDIRLISDVPFSNDYKDTRWFESTNEQTSYFMAKRVIDSIGQANFQRIEGKHFIAFNRNLDALWGANYIMFRNTDYNSRWFYAFITKLEYVQKNVTYVHFEIDVLQTWMFDMNFKQSFVVREHCKLWNDDGSPVINTVDEGLNYGTDYEVRSVQKYVPYTDRFFMVIVTKTAIHDGDANQYLPTLNGLPQPLNYYIHPISLADVSFSVKIGGNLVPFSSARDVLKAIFKQTNAVNNVVSLYITEFCGIAPTYLSGGDLDFDILEVESVSVTGGGEQFHTLRLQEKTSYTTKASVISTDKYDTYADVVESKLLMYPYTVLILDDFKGNRVTLKNEYINSPSLTVKTKGSLGTSNKVSYNIDNYLQNGIANENIIELENALINNSPNDLPILSDYLSAYLQGNRNTIENQKNSIVFNGGMDMIGSLIGGVSSAGSGNIAGAGSAGVGIARGAGNTVFQLQAIQAKQKDIGNIPPALVKLGGNAQFDFGNGLTGVYIIKKQITAEYRKKLNDFFNMFGYKVNEVKIPNFHTRRYWNYVQTASCIITGNFNNEDLQELKQIFDNGITLWHTNDIGNYAVTNDEVSI